MVVSPPSQKKVRAVRSAGGRGREDAFTRSLCAWLTFQLANVMPTFRTGKKLLVGQLEKLDFGLRELRRTADVEVHERVDLRAWTTLGVGGVAALVARCYSDNGVRDALDLTASHGFGWVVLGGGSRLVTPDRGVRVPVLSLTGEVARWQVDADGIVAGGGANMAQVCRAASRIGLSGLEHLGPEQHSVGGLVAASATGVANLSGLLDWVELQRPGGSVERWTATSAGTRTSRHRSIR